MSSPAGHTMDSDALGTGAIAPAHNAMLRQAEVLATRLASGRSARAIVLVSEHHSRLLAALLEIGDRLSDRGHDVVFIDEPGTAGTKLAAAIGAIAEDRPTGRATVLLIPVLGDLDGPTLATLLDNLHLAARDGLPLGCIATGAPQVRALLGAKRSFAERLIEFRSVVCG